MLFSRLGRAALGAVAALQFLFEPIALAQGGSNNDNQSTFVTDDGRLAFAMVVPDGTRDVYFSLRVHASRSWGAVGLGHDSMEGSLVFMLYRNAAGDNVTFSPRVAQGNYEPAFFDEMRWDVLNGTGIDEDEGWMTFSAKCTEHCRSWPHGSIDFSSNSQNAIYALGPPGWLGSDERDAPLPMHYEHGRFTIDMGRTNGRSSAPQLGDDPESSGAELVDSGTSGADLKSTFHAVFMILSIVILLPAGQLLMLLGKQVKLHAAVQTGALVLAIVGVGLGIATSFLFQRSRGFDSAHQIIGLIVFAFLFGQFGLGVFHHTKFKKTQLPTKLERPHRWLGRLILFLGTLNAFFGFPFALNRQYSYLLAGLVIAMVAISVVLIFSRRHMQRRRGPNVNGPFYGGHPAQGYNPEPWRQQPGANAAPQAGWGLANQASPPPYQYHQQPQASPPGPQIGLTAMPPSPRDTAKEDGSGSNRDLGPAQAPREML